MSKRKTLYMHIIIKNIKIILKNICSLSLSLYIFGESFNLLWRPFLMIILYYHIKTPIDSTIYIFIYLEKVSTWRPLLMITLYHQIKIPINLRSLIQLLETLPVELIETYCIYIKCGILVIVIQKRDVIVISWYVW